MPPDTVTCFGKQPASDGVSWTGQASADVGVTAVETPARVTW
jgi:hypothetical protein